jgi:hypothetical protein
VIVSSSGRPRNDLGLVGLADRLEVFDRLVPVPDLADDLLVAIDDLAHPLLDRGQVVQAERRVTGEVVVEAVVDRRTDGHLRTGKQLLHRLGHHVAGVVADGLQRFGALARQDLEGAALVERAVQVAQLAVELHQHRLLLQRLGDGGGDLAARHAVVELAL